MRVDGLGDDHLKNLSEENEKNVGKREKNFKRFKKRKLDDSVL